MPSTHDKTPQQNISTVVVLGQMLDIAQAQTLKAELAQCLASGLAVRLDARRVERVDASVLQLLCAFMGAADTNNVSCVWNDVSPAMRTAVELTGLNHVLRLPAAG
ncbi:MAG TPA: STAS domain-containing protein [Gammaproteobacteria bacterium]